MRTPFTGVGTALVTPFRNDGSVDEAAVRRLARRQIDGGVHFLSPVGTTGEAPTLSHAEKLRVIELVVEDTGEGIEPAALERVFAPKLTPLREGLMTYLGR